VNAGGIADHQSGAHQPLSGLEIQCLNLRFRYFISKALEWGRVQGVVSHIRKQLPLCLAGRGLAQTGRVLNDSPQILSR
jgi:hypothetical protein